MKDDRFLVSIGSYSEDIRLARLYHDQELAINAAHLVHGTVMSVTIVISVPMENKDA